MTEIPPFRVGFHIGFRYCGKPPRPPRSRVGAGHGLPQHSLGLTDDPSGALPPHTPPDLEEVADLLVVPAVHPAGAGGLAVRLGQEDDGVGETPARHWSLLGVYVGHPRERYGEGNVLPAAPAFVGANIGHHAGHPRELVANGETGVHNADRLLLHLQHGVFRRRVIGPRRLARGHEKRPAGTAPRQERCAIVLGIHFQCGEQARRQRRDPWNPVLPNHGQKGGLTSALWDSGWSLRSASPPRTRTAPRLALPATTRIAPGGGAVPPRNPTEVARPSSPPEVRRGSSPRQVSRTDRPRPCSGSPASPCVAPFYCGLHRDRPGLPRRL